MEASLAPPRTVKSSPPTTTRRPSMRPVPITKLAGRMEARVSPSYFATPARAPVSWNESRSSRRSIRSRTVSRPGLVLALDVLGAAHRARELLAPLELFDLGIPVHFGPYDTVGT